MVSRRVGAARARAASDPDLRGDGIGRTPGKHSAGKPEPRGRSLPADQSGSTLAGRFQRTGREGRESRTFLLSSQGYYTEWIRGAWIQTASAKQPFTPTDQAILGALRQWGATRESFEARFVKNRVPVN